MPGEGETERRLESLLHPFMQSLSYLSLCLSVYQDAHYTMHNVILWLQLRGCPDFICINVDLMHIMRAGLSTAQNWFLLLISSLFFFLSVCEPFLWDLLLLLPPPKCRIPLYSYELRNYIFHLFLGPRCACEFLESFPHKTIVSAVERES